MCTALVPEIGYDEAAKIARAALESGRPVREIAQEHPSFRDRRSRLDLLLNPWDLTQPRTLAPVTSDTGNAIP
jgi:aspartate ammonia-lyase